MKPTHSTLVDVQTAMIGIGGRLINKTEASNIKNALDAMLNKIDDYNKRLKVVRIEGAMLGQTIPDFPKQSQEDRPSATMSPKPRR